VCLFGYDERLRFFSERPGLSTYHPVGKSHDTVEDRAPASLHRLQKRFSMGGGRNSHPALRMSPLISSAPFEADENPAKKTRIQANKRAAAGLTTVEWQGHNSRPAR